MGMPCPPNPAPPVGTTLWPANKAVSKAILDWSRSNLKYPKWTLVVSNIDGQDVVARLETHYHEPGGTVQPWGCHKGNTIYLPTAPLQQSQFGIFPPTTIDPADAADAVSDTYVVAGDQSIDAGSDAVPAIQKTDWPLVIASGAAIAATVAAFVLALKLAGRPRLPR